MWWTVGADQMVGGIPRCRRWAKRARHERLRAGACGNPTTCSGDRRRGGRVPHLFCAYDLSNQLPVITTPASLFRTQSGHGATGVRDKAFPYRYSLPETHFKFNYDSVRFVNHAPAPLRRCYSYSMHAGLVEVRWCVQAREQKIMTLLELLAGKGATPEAVEASIRQMVQDETTRILAAAQSGEQTALDREAVIVDHVIDRLKLEIVPADLQIRFYKNDPRKLIYLPTRTCGLLITGRRSTSPSGADRLKADVTRVYPRTAVNQSGGPGLELIVGPWCCTRYRGSSGAS
jgi:hypothetical protein